MTQAMHEAEGFCALSRSILMFDGLQRKQQGGDQPAEIA
jgi:hypothetical protein